MKKWNKPLLIALTVLTGLLLLGLTIGFIQTNDSRGRESAGQKNSSAETFSADKIHLLVNEVRTRNGGASLVRDKKLDDSARAKCYDMLDRGYYEHNTPEGKTPSSFVKNYNYTAFGENLNGYDTQNPSSQAVVDSWADSADHFKNIVRSNFNRTGIAICGDMVVQHFAQQ